MFENMLFYKQWLSDNEKDIKIPPVRMLATGHDS